MKRQEMPTHGDKWRNQEGLKGLQSPFVQSKRNLTPKFKGLYNPKNSKLSRPFPAKSGCALDGDLNDPQSLSPN